MIAEAIATADRVLLQLMLLAGLAGGVAGVTLLAAGVAVWRLLRGTVRAAMGAGRGLRGRLSREQPSPHPLVPEDAERRSQPHRPAWAHTDKEAA